MTWWQRALCFVFWPVIFAALCGIILVTGFIVWIAIPFGAWLKDESMSEDRYRRLMSGIIYAELTPQEMEAGWHWCNDFDSLLVGPGMDEQKYCHCEDT